MATRSRSRSRFHAPRKRRRIDINKHKKALNFFAGFKPFQRSLLQMLRGIAGVKSNKQS